MILTQITSGKLDDIVGKSIKKLINVYVCNQVPGGSGIGVVFDDNTFIVFTSILSHGEIIVLPWIKHLQNEYLDTGECIPITPDLSKYKEIINEQKT